jgi:hypothetical protein
MSAHIVDHGPLLENGRRGVDIRLLELAKILSEQLPRMGCQKIHDKMYDQACQSVVVV